MSNARNLIFEAVGNKSNKSKAKLDIFEYQVVPSANSSIPWKKANSFRNNFFISPFFTITVVNISVLFGLFLLGFGIFYGFLASNPKQYGDFCNFTSECSQADNFVCSNYKCSCPSGKYYTTSCLNQYGYASSCTSDNECGYGLNCLTNKQSVSKCLCSSERFWNTNSNYCDLFLSYNKTGCTESSNCVPNTNLQCLNSMCTCVYPNYWNGTYCLSKRTYLDTCSIEQGCDETQLLNCTITGDYIYRCDCTSDKFWSTSSKICTTKYLNGSNCNSTTECRSDLGLKCSGVSASLSQCLCSSTFYWDGTQCLSKRNQTQSCSAIQPCDTSQGLVCTSGTCQCPTNYFYNGVSCEYILSSGFSCIATSMCDTSKGLQCDVTTQKCICPSTQFWNNTNCVTKFLNGSSCINNIQCDTTRLLSCDSTYKQCLCASTNYWTGATCTGKNTYGVSCSQTYQCQDYRGLYCSTTCQCPAGYYWNVASSQCFTQLTYYMSCPTNLYEPCLQTSGLTCQSNICKCTDPTKYWNSNLCVPKLLYGVNCVYQTPINLNSQCADYSPYSLVCRASLLVYNTWTCDCPATHYYNSVTGQCINKRTWNGACSKSSECMDYYGLICYSNSTCLCPSSKYWDSSASLCKEKLARGQPCTVTANGANEMCQDYAYVYCISGICACVSSRYFSTSFQACLPKSNHNQYCDSDQECITTASAYQLKCVSNSCQCKNYVTDTAELYWSANSQTCRLCPTGYSSGYGLTIYNSPNRIVNRCYKVVDATSYNYDSGQANCQTNSANLMTVRNIMEMNIIKLQFWKSNFRYILGSKSLNPPVYTWDFNSAKPVDYMFFCLNEPNGSNGGENTIQFVNGFCFNDISHLTNSFGFICELG